MIRPIAAACVAALTAPAATASSLPAPNTGLEVRRATEAGPVIYSAPFVAPELAPCRVAAGRAARLYFTFTDPQGVDYAAVRMGAEAVRPAVSDHVETYLWIAPALRGADAYQWRLDDEDLLLVRRTIPVAIEVIGAPIEVTVEVKDGAGQIVDEAFLLDPATILCR